MKNKLKLRYILICLTIISSFTGCFPNGEIEPAQAEHIENILDINQSDNENIIYDFKIDDIEQHEYPNLYVKRKIWDSSIINDIFSVDNTNVTTEIQQPSDYFPEKDYYHCYHFIDNSVLAYDAGTIFYLTEKAEKNNYTIYDSYYNIMFTADNMREIFPKTKLTSFSSENAESEMKKIIEKLAVSVNETPEIYALDKETVSNVDNNLELHDEAYMITYSCEFDYLQLPNFSIYSSLNDTITVPFRIVGIFSKEGLEFFDCWCAIEIVEEKDEIDICDAQTAISVVKNRMKSMAMDNIDYKIYISGCELIYVPIVFDEGYILKPMWCFIQNSKIPLNDGGIYDYYEEIFVDAQTSQIFQ